MVPVVVGALRWRQGGSSSGAPCSAAVAEQALCTLRNLAFHALNDDVSLTVLGEEAPAVVPGVGLEEPGAVEDEDHDSALLPALPTVVATLPRHAHAPGVCEVVCFGLCCRGCLGVCFFEGAVCACVWGGAGGAAACFFLSCFVWWLCGGVGGGGGGGGHLC